MAALSAHAAVGAYAQRDNLRCAEGGVFWLESDPATGLVGLHTWRDGTARRLTPREFGVRSQVNGYGGGAFCVMHGALYLVSGGDQQIHRLDLDSGALSAVSDRPGCRFGGLVADPSRGRILAVCEHLDDGFGVGQSLVALDVETGALLTLAGAERGSVNLGCPTLSADGRLLAWVEWTLPAMPWEQTRLRRAVLDGSGQMAAMEDCSAPAPASIQQPRFVGDQLYALSDHGGWWQPYRVDDYSCWRLLSLDHCDHANAPWQLDERHDAWLGGERWVRVQYQSGLGSLVLVDAQGRLQRRLAEEFTDFRHLQTMDHRIHAIARSPYRLDSIVRIDPETGDCETLAGGEQTPACQEMAPPEPFSFDARDGQPVHGFLYRPMVEASEPPPVVMRVHGGPTSAAYPVFDPQVAFWTSHGFAVADVNHRGSTGYGRAFRMALQGRWGEADHEDICDGVSYLARAQLVDGERAFIMGRSAGGFTVLNALIHSPVFRAGASLFGVSDPESLRHMTHRFESGYLDWLLGDPETELVTWQQRTPLFWADRITCPVIFFQGEQDAVVVPEQTESMAHVLRRCGVPVEVVRFADEGHGFRHAENQVTVMERTLRFFRQALDGG